MIAGAGTTCSRRSSIRGIGPETGRITNPQPLRKCASLWTLLADFAAALRGAEGPRRSAHGQSRRIRVIVLGCRRNLVAVTRSIRRLDDEAGRTTHDGGRRRAPAADPTVEAIAPSRAHSWSLPPATLSKSIDSH